MGKLCKMHRCFIRILLTSNNNSLPLRISISTNAFFSHKRLHSSVANSVWTRLREAEIHGDGLYAERLFDQVLQEYKSNLSSAPAVEALNMNDFDDRDKKYTHLLDRRIFSLVLKAHSRSNETGAFERAENFLQKMRADSSLPNPEVDQYNLVLSMVKSHRQQNDIMIADKVEELIQQMKDDMVQPNSMSYEYGIDCLSRVGEPVRAETLLANLVRDYFLQYDADLKPSITPFQSVLFAYSKARFPDAAERAESVLNNMKELSTYLDTYPTVWSYNIVMKCWSRSKSCNAASRAMALYDELRRRENNEGTTRTEDVSSDDLKPDATSLNTVLNSYSSNHSAVQTEAILWKLFERHVQEPEFNPCPDKIAFTTTIKAWSKSNDPDAPHRAESLLQKLLDLYNDENNKIFKPDVITYSSVMQCWVKSKKKESPFKVEAILRHLQNTDVSPDAAIWNSAISAWALVGNGERAENLFLHMVNAHQMNPKTVPSPNHITLTNVLNAWSKTRSPEASNRAIALLEKIEKWYIDQTLLVKPNVFNYSVAIDCLAYGKNKSAAKRAESILRKMATSKDKDLTPTVVTYNSVIKAWSFARNPQSITRMTCLLREIIEKSDNLKMKPNSTTFGQILKFLNENNLPDKKNRAKALKNLMEIFLPDGPKDWVQRELHKCLR